MTPRERFLSDCAQLWDTSDDRAVFAFGAPGSMVGLFAGPMTLHRIGRWACFYLDHADVAAIDALSARLNALGECEPLHTH